MFTRTIVEISPSAASNIDGQSESLKCKTYTHVTRWRKANLSVKTKKKLVKFHTKKSHTRNRIKTLIFRHSTYQLTTPRKMLLPRLLHSLLSIQATLHRTIIRTTRKERYRKPIGQLPTETMTKAKSRDSDDNDIAVNTQLNAATMRRTELHHKQNKNDTTRLWYEHKV